MEKLKKQLQTLASYFGAIAEGNIEMSDAMDCYNETMAMIDKFIEDNNNG